MHAARNVATRMPIATVSEQQWHQAFCELRRDDWPASLAELRRQSLEYRLVRLRATLIARGIWGNPVAPADSTNRRCDGSLVSTATGGSRFSAAALDCGLDRKRLAAGERADD